MKQGIVSCRKNIWPNTTHGLRASRVMRYENRYFQLERTSDHPPRQAKMTVCEWEDGRTEIRYKNKARPHREIEPPKTPPVTIRLDIPPKPSHWKQPATHPWRKPASNPGDDGGLCLRFALTARPSDLAGLRSGSGPHLGKEPVTKEKRGHF
jgi:hypothetical protein